MSFARRIERAATPAMALLLCAALVLFSGGCGKEPGTGDSHSAKPSAEKDASPSKESPASSGGDSTQTTPKAEKAISVDAGLVRMGALVRSIHADGTLRTPRSLEVRAKVSGELSEVAVRDGDRVKAGQLLARVDPRQYAISLEDSRYRHLRALSQIAAESDTVAADPAAFARFEERRKALEEDLRAKRIHVETYQARLLDLELTAHKEGAFRREVFEQRTGLAEARLAEERAKLELEYTEIRAPFGGIVENVQVVPGEIVQVGASICGIYDNSRLEAVLRVLEADLGNLVEGRPALLAVPATDDTLSAAVDVISPRLDETSRTCEVIVRFPNSSGQLRPGMFVRAEIAGWVYPDRLLVPKAAVLVRDERPLVFKVNGDRAQWLYVDTGQENDDWVEITGVHSGGSLAPGEQVVVSDHLTLAHDAKLNVRRVRPTIDRWGDRVSAVAESKS
ncbi:MAG: efflux RND transporter periplasmic adaptor subunit [Candidatus Eisenbacteria bacterium]|nr:efflux RND transporter periplasmic adaptor subunit [Candidatus Eisenbacteria bacterium]